MTLINPSTLPCQRDLFDIPDEVAYLNCAYMGPLMHAVIEAGEQGVRAKGRPWEIAGGDFFSEGERARELFARLIGADAEGVALVPSASYGLSCAARNLQLAPHHRIIVLAEQFPSNVYAWREAARTSGASLETLPRPADDDWSRAVLAAIDERTAVVAVPHCHWTDGGLLDLARVGARCREVGAALVVDLTQSAGALQFETSAVQPDFVACAGYKWLLGPYSMGFLWVAPRHRDGQPIEYNWSARAGAEDFARLVDYRDEYRPGARRFDVGENANFVLVPMLNTALEQILDWGVAAIEATLSARNARIAERAADLGFRALPEAVRAGHFLGLRYPDGDPPDGLAARLAAEQVYVSVRGSSIRVTPHLYNTDADVDRFFGVLAKLANSHG
jgi:selenocysteine lyase/cysteine desulfurase